jgi:predicted phage replisome organizer
MSDNKKYYYLKLKDNFFDSDEMIVLESMQDGYLYSNILLKLYLRSLKNEGRLMFNNRIPFNATMLAQVTRHNVGVIEKAMKLFKELNLIEVLDNGAIYMSDIQNFIGQSSTEADRKREYRNRIEAEKNGDTTLLGQTSDKCPDKTPPEKEIELEREIELEKKERKTLQCNDDVTKSNTEKESKKKTSRLKFETFDMKLATKLYDMMKQNNDGVKKPNFDNWANEIRLMRERDNRTEEQIDYVIEYSQNDVFWSTVVLSVKSLRKNFDKIVVQIKKNKQNKRVEKKQDTSYNDVTGTDIDLM